VPGEGGGGADEAGEVAGRVGRPQPVVLHVPVEPAPGEDPRGVGRPAAAAQHQVDAGADHAAGGAAPGRLPAAGQPDRAEAVGEDAVVGAPGVVVVLPDRGLVLVVQVGGPVGVGQHVGVAGVAAPLGQVAAANAAAQLPGQVLEQLVGGAVDRGGHLPEPLVVDVGTGEGLGQDDDVGVVLPGGGADEVLAALHVPVELADPQGRLDGGNLDGAAHHTTSLTLDLAAALVISPSSARRSLRWGTAAGTYPPAAAAVRRWSGSPLQASQLWPSIRLRRAMRPRSR